MTVVWSVCMHVQHGTQAHFGPSQRDPATDGVTEKFPYVGQLLADRKTGEVLGRQVAKRGKKLQVKLLDQSIAEFTAKQAQKLESPLVSFEVRLLDGHISLTIIHDGTPSS